MPGQFLSPDGDLESAFVSDPAIIDQFAKTGSLWGWGKNTDGQIGDGTTTSRSIPVQTVSLSINWKQVSNAPIYSYASSAGIKTDGTLWVWGTGDSGRIGDGTTVSKSSPVQISGTTWKQVSCGGRFTGSIKTDGTLWMWGYADQGQLGDNTFASKSSPVQVVPNSNNWKMVACGGYASMAIKTDGTLWGWGSNSYGTIGSNAASPSTPVQTAAAGTNWKQVSVGYLHSGAVKTDGTLWMWGYNPRYYSALGDGGSDTNQYSPVQTAAGGTNWKQISCGNNSSAAVKTDGTLWVWGQNPYGQLGTGDTTNRSSPVQTISGGTNWKMVSAGNYHMAAIKTDGTLWSWGWNSHGNLGDGTSTPGDYSGKNSPVQTITGGTNWKQVSAGQHGSLAIHFYDAGNLYP